ncbi:glycosyltransferase family 8 protein [Butyrivibrio proteoclasticus]|uniref:glycosyltransferase family 8 protein n=1 Tax=Butyrivibrio proteoclasticus TaxID=43305 RepID=UPI00047DB764|nr:glycosyltransferase family 8 protein [Butyrivibrio proteoclasticus]
MNISLAFDNKYVPYAYVTLLSVFENNKDTDITIYVLQYDLTDEAKHKLEKLCNKYGNQIIYLFVDTSHFEGKLPTLQKWPVEVYFRLLLPDLLPEAVDRILYLDSDMIINSSLSELYDQDLDDYDMAACFDLYLLDTDLSTFLYYRSDKLSDLFTSKKYINSGCLLLNIDNLRKNYSIESYKAAAQELNNKIYAPDQDLINYVHRGRIKLIDSKKYNCPAYIAYRENRGDVNIVKKNVTILHFTGEKPWKGGSHAHYSIESIWWEYAYKTDYSDEFQKHFIDECLNDETILKQTTGNDEVKIALLQENARLKQELSVTAESMKKVLSIFEGKK